MAAMPFGSLAARRPSGVRVHGFASLPLGRFAFVVDSEAPVDAVAHASTLPVPNTAGVTLVGSPVWAICPGDGTAVVLAQVGRSRRSSHWPELQVIAMADLRCQRTRTTRSRSYRGCNTDEMATHRCHGQLGGEWWCS